MPQNDSTTKNPPSSATPNLDAIKGIKVVRFNYREDNPLGLDPDFEHVGVVAQELQEVLPDAVIKNKEDGYLRIIPNTVLWTMVNAIKELDQKLAATEQQVTELQRQLGDK